MLGERALLAFRALRRAYVLSELHEQIVQVHPVFFWKNSPEFSFCFLRRLGGCPSKAVAHAVHVGIDGNAVIIEAVNKNDVCRFPSDAFQCKQPFHSVRHLIAISMYYS